MLRIGGVDLRGQLDTVGHLVFGAHDGRRQHSRCRVHGWPRGRIRHWRGDCRSHPAQTSAARLRRARRRRDPDRPRAAMGTEGAHTTSQVVVRRRKSRPALRIGPPDVLPAALHHPIARHRRHVSDGRPVVCHTRTGNWPVGRRALRREHHRRRHRRSRGWFRSAAVDWLVQYRACRDGCEPARGNSGDRGVVTTSRRRARGWCDGATRTGTVASDRHTRQETAAHAVVRTGTTSSSRATTGEVATRRDASCALRVSRR